MCNRHQRKTLKLTSVKKKEYNYPKHPIVMNRTQQHSFTDIRRSCITGNAVWIYQGSSKSSAQTAYWKACRAEIERVRNWASTAARRMANIERLLNDCLAEIPINAELTQRQQDAVRRLQAIERKNFACNRDFYEHILEERHRRKQNKKLRIKMRERRKI